MSAGKLILIDIFAVIVHGSDVYPGICPYGIFLTDSFVDVTCVNFNSKKVYEGEILAKKKTPSYASYLQLFWICKSTHFATSGRGLSPMDSE